VGAPANSWAVSGGGRRYGRLVDGYDTTISGGSLVFVLVLVLLLAVVVVVLLAAEVMILLLLAVVGQGLELGLGLGLLRTGARTGARGLGLEDWG